MKYCQKQCRRLGERVQGLLKPLISLQDQEGSNLEGLTPILESFQMVLKESEQLIEKYNKKSNVEKFLKAGQNKILFSDVNRRLSDVWEELSLHLQVQQLGQGTGPSERASWAREDQLDAEKDRQDFQMLADEGMLGGEGSPCQLTLKCQSCKEVEKGLVLFWLQYMVSCRELSSTQTSTSVPVFPHPTSCTSPNKLPTEDWFSVSFVFGHYYSLPLLFLYSVPS